VVYAGGTDGKLHAFDAGGCPGEPTTPCDPLWTAATGGTAIESSPTVVNGVVYIGSYDGKLCAFDAAGVTNCSGSPKTCQPLWTAATTGRIAYSIAGRREWCRLHRLG
jgi:outer membrane protein assembly factor BamB